MAKLIIMNDGIARCFNPNRQYFDIFDYLKNELGWDHREADRAASWAEMAVAGSVYTTNDPKLKIYIV